MYSMRAHCCEGNDLGMGISHSENSGACSRVRLLAVVANRLCRGAAGWHQGVLRRRGLCPTFLAEHLPAELMGGKTGGLAVQSNRHYL